MLKLSTTKRIALSALIRYGSFLPAPLYLKLVFPLRVGYKLNLKSPKTYNEKLQWLKLYDQNPRYTNMVDKVEAKKYVASIIGDSYIIKTLGVWNSFDEIDFTKLPDQFVLKTSHDSGGVVIVKDKSTMDVEAARKKLTASLNNDYYKSHKEWPYKNVKHRILAEEYMEDESGELRDYKLFCFNGKMRALFIATDRFVQGEETKFDFFDENFNHLPFTNGHPNAAREITKPESFDEMKSLAEKLSKGIPHLRVDFYNIRGKIYFGELTFFHWSGMVPFEPIEWDRKFGDMIYIPQLNR